MYGAFALSTCNEGAAGEPANFMVCHLWKNLKQLCWGVNIFEAAGVEIESDAGGTHAEAGGSWY